MEMRHNENRRPISAEVNLRVGNFFDAFWSDGDDTAHVLGDGDSVVLTLFDDVLAHSPRRRQVPLVHGAVRAAADHFRVVVGPDDRSHAVVVALQVDEQVVGHHRVDMYDVALHGRELVSAVGETALANNTHTHFNDVLSPSM